MPQDYGHNFPYPDGAEANEIQDVSSKRFCFDILDMIIADSCIIIDTASSYRSKRICTPEWKEIGGFCEKVTYSSRLGLGATIACGLFVLAVVLHDLTDGLKIPMVTDALCFFIMGGMLGWITHDVLPGHDLHYETLFKYQPSIFKFLMLPTIVFGGSFRANARSLCIEGAQSMAFGIIGTLISIMVIGYGVQSADDYYGGLMYREIKPTEAFMLASVLSALNPIPVLGAFKSLGVEHKLTTLVYGESMLNAPVAILSYNLFASVENLEDSKGEGLWEVVKVFFLHKFFIGISCGILVSWMSAFLFRIVGVHPPHAHVVTAERPESELEPPALPESTFDMETSRDQNYKTVEQKETDKVRVWPVLPTNFSPT
jgi:hypothetical protein